MPVVPSARIDGDGTLISVGVVTAGTWTGEVWSGATVVVGVVDVDGDSVAEASVVTTVVGGTMVSANVRSGEVATSMFCARSRRLVSVTVAPPSRTTAATALAVMRRAVRCR